MVNTDTASYGLSDAMDRIFGRQPTTNSSGYAYINPNDKDFASKTNAQLARRDWDDYRKTFMPVHELFKDTVMSDKLVNEQLARVPGNINNAYAASKQNADMRMQRMGLAEADMGRADLSMALSQSGAENNIRQHAKERSVAAIAGAPMPTVGG
jgi:hypothetical protein